MYAAPRLSLLALAVTALPFSAAADGNDPTAIHACVKGNSITISSPAGACPTGWTPTHLAYHFEVVYEREDGFGIAEAYCDSGDPVLSCNCRGIYLGAPYFISPIIQACYPVSDLVGTPASASALAIGCRGEASGDLTIVATCLHRVL